jgi:hypothetical protein
VRTIRSINFRRLNIVLHRDIGYFLSGLIIIYCISGLALNHVDEWNPDFVIVRQEIPIPQKLTRKEVNDKHILEFNALVKESDHKLYDFPTNSQIKIYYDNATFQIDLDDQRGFYERLTRRPVLFESNILHRNNIKGWKWAADVFAFLLIIINVTGLFILRKKNGLLGRGKWFVLAGMLPPVLAVIIFEIFQK